MIVLQILQVGFTGFGFLLAWMAFSKLNELGGKMIDAKTRPSDQLVDKLLKAFRLNQWLACLFFGLAVLIAALSFLRPDPSISISIFPTQGGVDKMVVIKKDSARLEAGPNGAMEFVALAKTGLVVDVNEVVDRLRNTLAISTALQNKPSNSPVGSLIVEGGLDAK